MFNRSDKNFITIAGITLILLFMVIMAGAVVRATGSGMGCPDWPRCFGYYIPPTDPAQLDFHSHQEYKKGMMIIENDTLWRAKEKFVSGATFSYDHWEKYPVHNYAKFVVAQTWTEYINRLFGALSGLSSFVLLILAARRFKRDKISFWLVVLHFFTIGFVAWMGKVVVDSNLKPATITLHMLCAIIMVFIMIAIRYRTKRNANTISQLIVGRTTFVLTVFALIASLTQVVVGTQVRQHIDTIKNAMDGRSRETWIDQLTGEYAVHKWIAGAILLLNIYLFFSLKKLSLEMGTRKIVFANLIIVFAAYGAGVFMHNFNIPAFMQPLHLFAAMILCGVQFALVLRIQK